MDNNNNNNKRNSSKLKYYVSTKIESNRCLTRDLKKFFENPNDYFSPNDNFLIGTINKAPRYDQNNNIIPYSIIGPSNLFDRTKCNFVKLGTLKKWPKQREKSDSYKHLLRINKNFEKELNYRYINDDEIDSLMSERILNLKKESNTVRSSDNLVNNNETDMIGLPKSLTNRLTLQEKCLITKEKNIEQHNTLSRNISMKIHRSQDNLLMSRTRDFLQEKMQTYREDNSERKNLNCWINSLRMTKQQVKCPIIMPIISTFKSTLDLNVVRNSNELGLESINQPSRKMGNENLVCSLDLMKLKEVQNDKLMSLQIQGTNLLNEEINRIKLLKGRKIILKNEKETKVKIEETNY